MKTKESSMRLRSSLLSHTLRAIAPILLVMMTMGKAAGQTEHVLYEFQGGASDGENPSAGVISDASGNLYGTTNFGGFPAAGAVFELSPPTVEGGAWTETVLYEFQGENQS